MATWTPKDLKLLKDFYGKKPMKEIATRLGRSIPSVGMFLSKHRKDFPNIHNYGGRAKGYASTLKGKTTKVKATKVKAVAKPKVKAFKSPLLSK